VSVNVAQLVDRWIYWRCLVWVLMWI